MHPILFKVWGLTIHSYGFMIALGFFLAVGVAKHLARKSHIDEKKIVDLSFWLLFYGFIGSRILFVFTRLDYFSTDPIAIIRFWEGGFVFLGGLIGALICSIYFVKKYNMSIWKTADVGFPALVVGHIFGRGGCFFAGCCHGLPTEMPWGMRFYSSLVDPKYVGIPIHPTQLYEAFSLALIFVLLYVTFLRKRFDGQVALTYLIVYPIVRSVIEVFRGDKIRGFVIDGWVSTSQFISIIILIVSLVVLIKRLRDVSEKKSII